MKCIVIDCEVESTMEWYTNASGIFRIVAFCKQHLEAETVNIPHIYYHSSEKEANWCMLHRPKLH